MERFVPADEIASQMGAGVDPAPDALMQALAQIRSAQNQPLLPQDPLGQLATGLGGWLGGYRGTPNPMVEQALQLRQAQMGPLQQNFQNQMGLATMGRQLDVARAEIQNKKEDNLLSIADKLSQQDDDTSRRLGADIRGKILKNRGVIVPQDFVEQTSSRKISKETLGNAALLLSVTQGDLGVVSKNTGISPGLLAPIWMAIVKGDEGALKAFGLEPPSVIQGRLLDLRSKTQQILMNEFKINDPGVSADANLIAVAEFGKPFSQLTSSQRTYAAQKAIEFALKRDTARSGMQPVAAETARLLAGMENVERDLQISISTYEANRDKLKPFIGPMLSGAPLKNWLATNLPEEATAGGELAMPPELVDLKASLVRTRNVFLNARSGQAVTENELKRIMEELPNLSDNPSVFQQKLQMTAANQAVVVKRLQALSSVGGRERVNPAAVMLDNPLPIHEIKPRVPFKRKKERDGSITIVPERQ